MAGIAGREVGGSSRRPPRRSCWLLRIDDEPPPHRTGQRRTKGAWARGGWIKDTCIIEETVAPAGPPTPQLDWLQTKLSESRKAPAKIKLSSLWNQEVSTKVARTPSMSRKLKTEVPPSARGAALELAEVPTAPSTVHHRPAQASHDARKVTAP
ncbi:unnamed protein product [Prorocentrum cordatum]|uniref:Uncharacterized protein n=1 Tax=Prorocentrum cordatum TaxID=2364126 RepID=A0ABN9UG86_9DINO|nr:unnamed protein product [Polarella glacialis]